MNRPPEPPPEGVLIESARTQAKLSVREAARRAGISEGWWRQVARGYQSLSGGDYGPVRGVPAATIAKMASAAGVTPEQLESEGQRPDAAEALRDGTLRETPAPVPPPRRFSLPAPTEEMARDLAPFLSEVRARVQVAQAAHPGERLSGAMTFPGDPTAAAYWDLLAEADFAPEDAADALAAMLTWRRQLEQRRSQNGSAAGLMHRPLIHAVR